MSGISKTIITASDISTPIINANYGNFAKITLSDVDNITAKQAFIENLTVRDLTVLDDSVIGSDEKSETYEDVTFNNINLNFSDEYNCVYTVCDDNSLQTGEDCKFLNINFQIPAQLGSKLVCRYLVIDLQNESEETNVVTVWENGDSVKWMYGMPDIQAGYFYVLAFQRFKNDLIVGNVAVKIGGE